MEVQAQKAQGDPVMFASLGTLVERQLVDTGNSSGQGTFQEDASVHLGLRALFPFKQRMHVLARTDNRSAVYYVNHQGGTRSRRCLRTAQ